MKAILIVLIVALVAKDTSQLNDPYIMRGIAQGLCMGAGGIWLLSHISSTLLKKYWPVFAYLAALLVGAIWTAASQYVFLQLASLAAVLWFFVAYFEHRAMDAQHAVGTLIDTTVMVYFTVAVLSLMVIITHPTIAYGATGYAGMEFRFRGLFPKAGMLASAAGVTIGLAWFSGYRTPIKLIVLAVCGMCLALTLSRTFWVALALGGFTTYWVYHKLGRRWIVVALLVSASAGLAMKSLDVSLDFSNAKFLRVETISNLTGRVLLWEQGLLAFYHSPYVGYGYTVGATGLHFSENKNGQSGENIDATRDIGRMTLHSGYLQSLLDAGAIGTLFYLAIIAVALRNMMKQADTPRNRAVFFGLTFLAISNISQNVIYSASVYDSVLFFGLAIFAMSIGKTESQPEMAPLAENVNVRSPSVGYLGVRYKEELGKK